MENKIRTRYAPSPTGYFHVGGARTALFCYLFAKHNKGDFILRIEDTDQKRNVVKGIESQYNNLLWLGLSPDESLKKPGKFGPYVQSQKYDRYKTLIDKLIKDGRAYYCFCSEEELQVQRKEAIKNKLPPKYNRKCLGLTKKQIENNLNSGLPFVVRLKTDEGMYSWNDLIRGNISVPSSSMTDPVLWKSNGTPMYNFAVVVDDYDMKISHVLRGEEHISNTPYQMAIKKALNFNNDIVYGHLPIIIDEQGKKLSKRNKVLKQFIEDYKNMGFLPISIVNFLLLVGFSPKTNKEVMNIQQMIDVFDLSGISRSPATFDYNKMLWLAQKHVGSLGDDAYLNFIKPFINVDLTSISNKTNEILLLFKQQISYASQINDLVKDVFFNNNEKKIINRHVIECLVENLTKLKSLNLENISLMFKTIQSTCAVKGKELFMPIRVAITGLEHGPELNKIIYILGKEKVLNILKGPL